MLNRPVRQRPTPELQTPPIIMSSAGSRTLSNQLSEGGNCVGTMGGVLNRRCQIPVEAVDNLQEIQPGDALECLSEIKKIASLPSLVERAQLRPEQFLRRVG